MPLHSSESSALGKIGSLFLLAVASRSLASVNPEEIDSLEAGKPNKTSVRNIILDFSDYLNVGHYVFLIAASHPA